ncbi:MAG: hypothetical protein IJD67_02420 [Clostridia bacterium]|nr:hypothetical protein [Clostridia bacterium]
MSIINKTAKIFRVITIPPVLALLLLIYLNFGLEGYFTAPYELAIVIICLVIMPALAYPICFIVPSLRARGREAERSMAFVTTGIGYAALVIPALVCGFSEKLKIVCFTYVMSVIMLIIFNKVLKLKASGHACGVFGPLLVFVYAGGAIMALPCAVLLALTVWSSLRLKRHTLSELLLGGACSAVSLVAVVLVYSII